MDELLKLLETFALASLYFTFIARGAMVFLKLIKFYKLKDLRKKRKKKAPPAHDPAKT